ncbi:MAG: ribosome maturation factor RimM [Actinomycetota bacterium]|nr:ribosome maturation factor RimM [Actinomycetota bacterium]
MIDDDLVAVGRVGPARGVHGYVFVEPWTDDPDARFAAGMSLRTDPAESGPLTIASSSRAGGKLVVHFEGVDDREGAARIRGVRLMIASSQRAPIDDPDEFYDTDLIGLTATTTDGRPLGPVREVLHAGGADYLVLDVDDVQRLVPFVKAIVPTVDLCTGRVVIDAPPGLFEL